ncbi:MAG: DNA polymerase III subunit delta [Muribaculaceae bacterium]|nr:DNA polymerase III subunit delta [Muribaculaceae bacterium]
MAKKELIGYRDIIQAIKKRDCAPVYILMGEEAYYIDLIVDNFEHHYLDEADKDFNYNMFYGNDADVDYVVAAAQQFPVMSDRKLVILKEAQSMNRAKSELEKFAPYVSRPNMSTVFVIAYKGEKLNATSKLLKAAKESGAVVFESKSPYENKLPAYIKDYCQQQKVGIDDKAVSMLADYVGLPLSKLFGEISKLISVRKDKSARITCEDIEKNIGISKDYNNFELINALAVKDYPKAITIVRHFADSPKANPTPVTTGLLFNFFSNLLIAHYMADKSESALREHLGLRSIDQMKNMQNALRCYSAGQTVKAIRYLREFDTRSKGVGSLMNEYDLLAETIFKFFT